MFIGHYGPAYAAKAFAPRVSLGVYFVAAQALDFLFMTLVLAGVEKLRLVPGFTAVNAYDVYFMPYSHGLVAALAWSALAALGWRLARASRPSASLEALAIGAVVFSHFAADVLVHTPDLPLFGEGSAKLGLGLWRSRAATIAVELASLLGGAALLARRQPASPESRRRRGVFLGVLTALTVATPFLPTRATTASFAAQSLVAYVALAAVAALVDRARPDAPP